jgi:hypothetical protein
MVRGIDDFVDTTSGIPILHLFRVPCDEPIFTSVAIVKVMHEFGPNEISLFRRLMVQY